ncbi:MAG TPA: hypothetical protein VFL85_03785 [Candidatus Saccharimonadales bacterium]|nr:hypothetical protein [Candidatus Saccharimonadales bacterium]
MSKHTTKIVLGALGAAAVVGVTGFASMSPASALPFGGDAHHRGCEGTLTANGDTTFTVTLDGCKKPGPWYVNITDASTSPQRHVLTSPVYQWPDTKQFTTPAIPAEQFNKQCELYVQADIRYGGSKHGTSEFVKAWKGIVKLTTGECATSSPTSSPTTSPTTSPSPTSTSPSPTSTSPSPTSTSPSPTTTTQPASPSSSSTTTTQPAAVTTTTQTPTPTGEVPQKVQTDDGKLVTQSPLPWQVWALAGAGGLVLLGGAASGVRSSLKRRLND